MAPAATRPRVVFANRFFWPDHSATAQILTDLAVDLASAGWNVTVIASRLLYDGGEVPLAAHERFSGVRIVRVRTTRFGRGGLLGRACDYLSFYIAGFVAALRVLRCGDVLVVKTDPPLLQVPLGWAARLRGARQVNWLQDVYPELALGLGVRALNGVPARLLAGLRRRSLQRSARTVVIGGRMRDRIIAAGAPPASVREIHNWGDDTVLAAPAGPSPLRAEWGLTGERMVVGYSGNLGRAHDLATMIDAAGLLAEDQAPIDFLFVGGGALRRQLEAERSERGLSSIVSQPYQPRQALPQSLTVADLHWLSLKPELEGLIVPSKFYGAAASGRPLLFIGDPDGEVARLIAKHRCGWSFAPGDPVAVATLLRRLATDRGELAERGARARAMITEGYTRRHGVNAWKALLTELTPPGASISWE